MKHAVCSISALLLLSIASFGHAQVVLLTPSEVLAIPGGQFTVNVEYDFDGVPTVGGALDAFWDPSVLELVNWEFGPDSGDPVFNVQPDASMPGLLFQFGFGAFPSLPDTGVAFLMTFQVIAVGSATISLAETTGPFGGFPEFDPTFLGATLVPLPAAAWLLLGGVGMLLGLGRRRE